MRKSGFHIDLLLSAKSLAGESEQESVKISIRFDRAGFVEGADDGAVGVTITAISKNPGLNFELERTAEPNDFASLEFALHMLTLKLTELAIKWDFEMAGLDQVEADDPALRMLPQPRFAGSRLLHALQKSMNVDHLKLRSGHSDYPLKS